MQTCSQTITGRNRRYPTALRAIQEEDYLEEADFDLLKRIKRQYEYYPYAADVSNLTIAVDYNPLIPILVGIGVITGSILIKYPELPWVNEDLIPPGNPRPGEPGGGTFPFKASPDLLALVPPGLTPVAVFEPFAKPRTLPAKAIIFSEVPNIRKYAPKSGSKKKKPYGYHHPRSRKSRQIRSDEYHDYHYGQSENGLAALLRNFQCLRTNLFAKSNPEFVQELKWVSQEYPVIDPPSHYETSINSIDDCIEDIGEPSYGFFVIVTLVEDQPCILGETCRGEPIQEDYYQFGERQTNELFSTFAGPDCRVRFNPALPGCSK